MTTIGVGAFYGCTNLSSIDIPEGVTEINGSAFYGCSKLASVAIPKSVVYIGPVAFENTPWYNSFYNSQSDGVIYIGNVLYGYKGTMPSYTTIEVKEGTTCIADDAFSGCDGLSSIIIPEGVKRIGSQAFADCCNLSSISLPDGMEKIENTAFLSCSSLSSISIPNSLKTIDMEAFLCCYNLTEVHISSLKDWFDIDFMSFEANPLAYAKNLYVNGALVTELTIPDSVTAIKDYAFYCSNLTAVTIHDGVVSIGKEAFGNCSSLTGVHISSVDAWCNIDFGGSGANPLAASVYGTLYLNGKPITELVISEGMESIKNYAFQGLQNLISVTIPESVTSIGDFVFNGCRRLTSIVCQAFTPPSCDDAFLGVNKTTPLYVPESSIEAYRLADGWSDFTNIQPIAANKVILDTEESFIQTENENYDHISYTRTFNNTNWQALYVPFEIPVDADFASRFDVAYFNDVRSYDDDKDGAIDRMVMELFEIEEGNTLKANYPYLIRAKNTGEATITVTDAVLYATEENSISCSSVFMNYEVFGTYTRMTGAELQGCYAVSNGSWKQASSENVVLNPFRLWLKLTPIDGSPVKISEKAMRSISIRLSGEEDTAEIEGVELMPQGSDAIYDLQGRRVENPTKGIYIVNGKKVVLK